MNFQIGCTLAQSTSPGPKRYCPVVTVALLVLSGLLMWAGSALLLDAFMNRSPRPGLAERLAPFHRPYVADEAQRWLRDQS